jgi:hypothetical protein
MPGGKAIDTGCSKPPHPLGRGSVILIFLVPVVEVLVLQDIFLTLNAIQHLYTS